MDKYKYFLLVFMICGFSLAQAQVDEASPKNSLFYYSGYLGKTDKVEFNLQLTQLKVSGSYILEQSGELFVFSGRMATDKSGIGVLIYTDDNKYIASMEASLLSDENDFAREINGLWKSADGISVLPVTLKKVAELAQMQVETPSDVGD
ncbi:MAG: hypothetical protein AAF843_08450 [Bacteroidota bacterium]